MSKRIKIATVVLVGMFLILGLSYLFSNTKIRYTQPIGGWSVLKLQVEAKFSENKDIQKAALQVAKALQKSIDYPEDAKAIDLEMIKADSCFEAIMLDRGKTLDDYIDASKLLTDLSTASLERQKRYIRYNANLGGGVYPLVKADLKNCDFSY